tara:strand:- start:94 stop:615 length:522 start_codon:yes stop_codon:yes gene_type:complete
MEISKDYQKKVKKDFFFTEGIIELDEIYFIEKIKKGVEDKDNLNFKTNINGLMTSWEYFLQDKFFLDIINKFIIYVDNNNELPNYRLSAAWGFGLKKGDFTKIHDHKSCVWSGVLYFNDHKQTLDFDEINVKVKPEKGKFALFSSFLKHKSSEHFENNTKWGISFNFKEIKTF